MKKQILNEEFKRMQLLAGIITESEYKAKLIEDNTERLPDDKWYCKLSKDTANQKAGTWMYVNAKDKEEAIKGFGEEFDLSTLTNVNPTSESTDIVKSVNEALRKYRRLITKSQLNEAVKSIDSNTIQRTGDTPITKEDLVIGTTRVAPSMSYGSKEELALNAGTVTKVDGDKATYDVKGKMFSMDLADLLIVITT